MDEYEGTPFQEVADNDVQVELQQISTSLAGLELVSQSEAFQRLIDVYKNTFRIKLIDPSSVEQSKTQLDLSNCWRQIWQTAKGSQYYVLPSKVAVRWNPNFNPVFDPTPLQQPTLPVCFIPWKTVEDIVSAGHDKDFSLGMFLGRTPGVSTNGTLYERDTFKISRVEGSTTWHFKSGSMAPELGLCPFEFAQHRSLSNMSASLTELGIDITLTHGKFTSGRGDYRTPQYHSGHQIVDIRTF